jgi:helicase SWR1
MARNDAALLDRIEKFRRQGRLLPEQDVGLGVMSTATGTGHKRGGDLWDQVVEEVITQSRVKRNGGRQVASQIAGRIQGYWDGYALREDKAKAQEERRLRALAKATIKMVTSEWKKAVFVRYTIYRLVVGEAKTIFILFAAHTRTGKVAI